MQKTKEMQGKTRWILLGLAALLLAGALLLRGGASRGDPLEAVASAMRGAGYRISAEDFYSAGSYPNASVSALLAGQSLAEPIAASEAGGFPADVQSAGQVTLFLAALGSGDVVTVYVLDSRAALCFIQSADGKTVRSVIS